MSGRLVAILLCYLLIIEGLGIKISLIMLTAIVLLLITILMMVALVTLFMPIREILLYAGMISTCRCIGNLRDLK